MIRRPPRSTQSRSSAASDVYKRQVWDFYELETEGGLYLKDKNALSPVNSHPGKLFAGEAALLFGKFITDVIAGEIE